MIFNLFKSKPTLKELIPKGFVDIHSHILPGIDDGAKNIKQSLELISEMKKLGFSKIIGTPHTYPGLYENTNKTILKSYEILKSKLNFEIKLSYASEYMLEDSIIEKAKNKTLLCIKENYLLVEMSYISAPINLHEIIYELKINGYIPVIAHPERYYFLHNNFDKYLELKKIGCLFQGNLLSSTNYYGSYVNKTFEKLIGNNLIDFTGTDIHLISHIDAFNKKIKIDSVKLFEKLLEKNFYFK